MTLSILTSPAGLFSAGIVLLIGLLWLRFRTRPKQMPSGSEQEMSRSLEAQKREVLRLIREAQQTTDRLERMIDAFEQTFYTGRGPNGSVAAIFNGLSDQMRQECRQMAEWTGRRPRGPLA